MAPQPRIDALGALHHIIIRAIERKAIFREERDRERFLERLGSVLAADRRLRQRKERLIRITDKSQEQTPFFFFGKDFRPHRDLFYVRNFLRRLYLFQRSCIQKYCSGYLRMIASISRFILPVRR